MLAPFSRITQNLPPYGGGWRHLLPPVGWRDLPPPVSYVQIGGKSAIPCCLRPSLAASGCPSLPQVVPCRIRKPKVVGLIITRVQYTRGREFDPPRGYPCPTTCLRLSLASPSFPTACPAKSFDTLATGLGGARSSTPFMIHDPPRRGLPRT